MTGTNEDVDAPFWAAARDGRLVVQFDGITGRAQFYPRPLGLGSGSRALEWREVSGRGHLASVTVLPARTGQADRVLAMVELDEGVRLLATVLAPAGQVRAGMRVRVVWQPREDLPPMFAFKPDAEENG